MSDGTEQSGADAVRTGEVRVPAGAGAVLPSDMGGDGGDAAEARAERETDAGELTPSDPSLDPSLDPGVPPANLAEPLR